MTKSRTNSGKSTTKKTNPKKYGRTVACNKGCGATRYGKVDSWRGARCPDCQVCDKCGTPRPRVDVTGALKWHGHTCADCKRNNSQGDRDRASRVVHTFESWKALRVDGRSAGWGKDGPKREMFASTQHHEKACALWLSGKLTFEQWRHAITERHDEAFAKDPNALPGWGADPRVRLDFRDKEEQMKAYEVWRARHMESAANVRSTENARRRWANGEISDVRARNGTGQETRICRDEVCGTQASFGFLDGKRQCCVKHQETGMLQLNVKKCEDPGCTTQPSYGEPGGAARYCVTHVRELKLPYVDVVTKRCEDNACDVMASYGYDGSNERTHCASHGTELGMVDNKTKRCSGVGCDVSAMFALPGEPRDVCERHRIDGMVNVIHSWCESECGSAAHYGPIGTLPKWCDRHKIHHDGVAFDPTKECETPLCRQFATHGSFHRSRHCENHAVGEMSITEHVCTGCHLVDILQDGLCEHCSGKSLRIRGYKQRSVKHLLDMHRIEYIHERAIGNTRFVPDFVIMHDTHATVLEVDEHGHSKYTGEDTRMKSIVGADPMIDLFIRFNPDGNASVGERNHMLLQAISDASRREKREPYVLPLFYDGSENLAVLL